MKVNTLKLTNSEYPAILKNLSDAPEILYWAGDSLNQLMASPRVAVVGSRKISPYGQIVTQRLASELAKAGVVIVSGLAYGVDATAHRAALEVGGLTVAVLPTSLDEIYPTAHQNLAEQIIKQGGALISEYVPKTIGFKQNFIARNRIVSGISDILLITEAAINSGSLHTARFALEQGKTVMVVPGNITSPTSVGCNNLIKSGAIPVTEAEDIFFALNLKPNKSKDPLTVFKGTKAEQELFDLIRHGISSQEELALTAKMDGPSIGSALTMLEIGGYIRSLGAGEWIVA